MAVPHKSCYEPHQKQNNSLLAPPYWHVNPTPTENPGTNHYQSPQMKHLILQSYAEGSH